MGSERGYATGLEATARALGNWRQQFGGPGRRIPDELWVAAAEVARSSGIARTARVLRLDVKKLASVAADTEPAHEVTFAPTAFVELGAAGIGGRESAQIEFVGREGDRVRVHVPEGARGAMDVVDLARAFWSRRS